MSLELKTGMEERGGFGNCHNTLGNLGKEKEMRPGRGRSMKNRQGGDGIWGRSKAENKGDRSVKMIKMQHVYALITQDKRNYYVS